MMSEKNRFFKNIFSHSEISSSKIITSSCNSDASYAFSRSKNKATRNNLLLSIVAIVQIITIIVVSTSAWIESVSNIILSSKGYIDTHTYSVATVTTDDIEIDLKQYIKKAGNLHFSEANLNNGNIRVRKYNADGSLNANDAFRNTTINDINVNYVNFSFYVQLPETSSETAFYFTKVPEIYIGKNLSKRLADNIRLSITCDGTTTVYAYENGTGVVSFESRVSDVPLFTVAPGEANKKLITVKMWLEDGNDATYTGNTITVNSLSISQLLPAQTSLALLYNSNSATSSYRIKRGAYVLDKVDYNMWVYNSVTKKSVMMKREENLLKWKIDLPHTFFKSKNDKITFYKCSDSVKENPQKSGNYLESWTTTLADARLANSSVYTIYGEKSGTWESEALLRPSTEDMAVN